MTKTAIILCNLGGPGSLAEVEGFLFKLFYDPAIFRLPNPFRWMLAKYVAKKRCKTAQHIYAQMGGKSPILEQTLAQATSIEQACARLFAPGDEARSFVVMRYTNPRSAQVAKEVMDYAPDKIVFVPLYPQYSTTTTASSLQEWRLEMSKLGNKVPISVLCCYPQAAGFIKAHAELLREQYAKVAAKNPRILFSAHGLPQMVIKDGDPYQQQVTLTCAAIVKELGVSELDFQICYQSKVGRLQWLEPSTEHELVRAGAEGRGVIVVPVAFVSEHSETLVELDIEYAELAKQSGVPFYLRVPALGTHPEFINELAALCLKLSQGSATIGANTGARICAQQFARCCCAA